MLIKDCWASKFDENNEKCKNNTIQVQQKLKPKVLNFPAINETSNYSYKVHAVTDSNTSSDNQAEESEKVQKN